VTSKSKEWTQNLMLEGGLILRLRDRDLEIKGGNSKAITGMKF
jgi:hypothetical protein